MRFIEFVENINSDLFQFQMGKICSWFEWHKTPFGYLISLSSSSSSSVCDELQNNNNNNTEMQQKIFNYIFIVDFIKQWKNVSTTFMSVCNPIAESSSFIHSFIHHVMYQVANCLWLAKRIFICWLFRKKWKISLLCNFVLQKLKVFLSAEKRIFKKDFRRKEKREKKIFSKELKWKIV